jgi:hypothetical protein
LEQAWPLKSVSKRAPGHWFMQSAQAGHHDRTGAGVTAGIDFAPVVAAELFGTPEAQRIQLAIEYRPAPPFDSGAPHTAPDEVREAVRGANAEALAHRRAP